MKTLFSDEWSEDFLAGVMAYYLTSLPVLLGMLFGMHFLYAPDGTLLTQNSDLLVACYRSDALHYLEIIREGYSYDPTQRSMVAFFPSIRC